MKGKAIGLLSGGLDSTLATKLIIEQEIEVIGLNFSSIFCLCGRGGCSVNFIAKELGIKLRTVNKGEEYLEIVKNPVFGYGKGCNPCIDCRIYMFKKAKEIMEEEKADFIFTGEVLNQRPFSQKKHFLFLIEEKAGLKGKILRPLSAKSLPPTEPEIKGIVDRERLLAIKGRSRKTQIFLADYFNIKGYACPSGGCLLTDPIFSEKLKEMFKRWPDCNINDVKLLKYGKIFWFDNFLFVISRNENENRILNQLAKEKDIILNFDSQIVLIRGEKINKENIKEFRDIILKNFHKLDKNRLSF